jgi:hypothetical protein
VELRDGLALLRDDIVLPAHDLARANAVRAGPHTNLALPNADRANLLDTRAPRVRTIISVQPSSPEDDASLADAP